MAPASSSFSMPAQSRFTSVEARWRGGPGVTLTVRAAAGETNAHGSLMTLSQAATSSWSFVADVSCGRFEACHGISFSISQPLRIDGGEATTTLADVPLDYSDPITFSRRTLSLAPSGRELDLGLGVHRPIGPGALRLQASALIEPGHQAGAPIAYGLSAAYRTRF